MWQWLKLFFFITVLMLGSGTMNISYRAQAQDEMSDEEEVYVEEGEEEPAVAEPAPAATAAPTPEASAPKPAQQDGEMPVSPAMPEPEKSVAAEPAAVTPPAPAPAEEEAGDFEEAEAAVTLAAPATPAPTPAPAEPAAATPPAPEAEKVPIPAATEEEAGDFEEEGTTISSPAPIMPPAPAAAEPSVLIPVAPAENTAAPMVPPAPANASASEELAETEEEAASPVMPEPAKAPETATAPPADPGTAGKAEAPPAAPASEPEPDEFEGEEVEEPEVAPGVKTETAPAPAAAGQSASGEPDTGEDTEELETGQVLKPDAKQAQSLESDSALEAGNEDVESEESQPEKLQPGIPAKEEKTAADAEEELSEEEEFLKEEAEIGGDKAPKAKKPEKAEGEPQAEEEGWTEEWGGEAAEEAPKDEIPEVEVSRKIPNILTTLEDCKRVALMNDRRIQVALKQINYERYKIQEAERAFLPGLKGTFERQEGDAASSQTSGQTSSGPDTTFKGLKYGLEGEQIVFNGGKLIYTLKQAKNNLEVAKKKYYQARQELIFKVEKAYYTLVKAQMVFEVQADLSKDAESALSFSREAYRQGLNSYHEFLNVQSQTDQTYYQLLSHQQEITLGELGLRQACNIDASIGLQIDAVLTFTDFNFNYSLDECLELAFKNRPDLAVNELTTLSDLYGIKLAMAEGFPKIQFTGTIGKNGQKQNDEKLELTDEFNLKLEASWVLGANTSKYTYERKKTVPNKIGVQDNTKDSITHKAEVSLFDKMEVLSNTAKSQVQQATSEADYIELRGKVANEVEENYFNYQKAMTMVTASLSKIKFREKDLEVNRAKQMMDEIPLSQVLTSELQLGEERINYVGALADYYIAISGLFKAMGLAK